MTEVRPENDVGAPSKRRSWPRRILPWLLGTIAGLVGLALSIVAALLYSPGLSGWVVRTGVEIYAEAIPGDAEVRDVEGALGGDLVLVGVRLEDSVGRSLVEVERLRLGLDVGALVSGSLDVGRLRIEGARVFLPSDERGGFGDLAPPADGLPEPEEPSAGLGPDLPLPIRVGLDVVDLEVVTGTEPDAARTLLALDELALTTAGAGRQATARLTLEAALPPRNLAIEWLAIELQWDEPRLRVSTLELVTSWGSIELEPTAVDFETMEATLGELRARVDPRWAYETAGVRPSGPVVVVLQGDGSPSGFRWEAAVDAPSMAALDLAVEGQFEPTLDVRARLGVAASTERLAPSLKPRDVAIAVELSARGDPQGELDVEGSIECPNCDPEGSSTAVRLAGSFDSQRQAGRGRIEATLAQTELSIDGALQPDGAYRARVDLDAPSLKAVRRVVASFLEVPALAGDAEASVTCEGVLQPLASRCDVEMTLERGVPVQMLKIDTSVAYADAIDVVLRALQAKARGGWLALRTPEAKIHLGAEAVSVEGLDVEVGTASGSGRVRASGAWGLTGEHDLTVHIDALELGALAALVPGLDLEGRVDARVGLQGTSASPRIEASLDARRVRFARALVGNTRTSVDYAQGRARVRLRHRGGPVDSIEVDVDAPLDLSFDGGPVGLRGDERLKVEAAVKGLALARAVAFAPQDVPLQGRMDVSAKFVGTASTPRASVSIEGRALEFEARLLGDFDLTVVADRAKVATEFSAENPAWDRLSLQAEVPVRLDLAASEFAWRSGAQHEADLQLLGLRLDRLSSWVPRPSLQGTVDVEGAVRGTMLRPRLKATIRGDDLGVDGRSVGELRLEAEYRDDQATVEAFAKGPLVEGLGLTASVPVTIAPGRGEVRWHDERPHQAELFLQGIDLEEVVAWSPTPVDVKGRGVLSFELDGQLTAPSLDLGVEFEHLVYGGRRVGDLALSAVHRPGDVEATLSLVHDGARRIDLETRVPVEMDLARGAVEWKREGEHRLSLRAPKIDRALVEPFVDLPSELAFDLSLGAEVLGRVSDFDADAKLEGRVELKGERVPLELTLDANEVEQRAALRLGSSTTPWITADGRTRISVASALDGELEASALPIELRARSLDVDLAGLSPLLPTDLHDLEGRLNLAVDVEGTVDRPVFDGHVDVSEGAVTVVSLRQRFESIELGVDLANDRIDLRRLSLTSGKGSLRGSGGARLDESGEIDARLSLVGDRLPLRRPGLPRMELSTKIDTEASVGDEAIAVGVEISESKVDVALGNVAAPKAIPGHERVYRVALGSDAPGWDAPPPEDSAEPVLVAPGRPLILEVALAEPFRIRGPAIDMAWEGSVNARVEDEEVSARGGLTASEGTFDLLGNAFEIESGSVTIPDGGELVPYLDVRAATSVDDVRIIANVRGRADAPELVLSSAPPHSESEIFTMLVTGSTDTESADPEEVQAQAASVLAALSNPALQRELNDKLKVDKIGLTFGDSTDQPILSVGKNVTKKVYAETQYHFNAPVNENRAQLEVRYRFAPRWSLETFFGDAAAGGVDVFWGVAFDGRLRSALKKEREKQRRAKEPKGAKEAD